MSVKLERIYDAGEGGYRVLVDRLWPRGISKERAALDEWCRDVAPSTELRRWYGHEPDRFEEFVRRYGAELEAEPAAAALAHLRDLADRGSLTLLTATRDVDRSAAAVLFTRLRDG